MSYIYRELSVNDIAHELRNDLDAGWSLNGAYALAEYLQEYVQDIKQPLELDIVVLRCDYSEWASLEDFNKSHFGGEKSREDEWYKNIDDLRDDAGTVLEFEGGIIVATF